jgi:hypothetical protein
LIEKIEKSKPGPPVSQSGISQAYTGKTGADTRPKILMIGILIVFAEAYKVHKLGRIDISKYPGVVGDFNLVCATQGTSVFCYI